MASPTGPWGQSVFARGGYETFTGLLADGDLSSARAMIRFLFGRTQQPDGSFPHDSLIDGAVAPDGCPCDRMGSGDG